MDKIVALPHLKLFTFEEMAEQKLAEAHNNGNTLVLDATYMDAYSFCYRFPGGFAKGLQAGASNIGAKAQVVEAIQIVKGLVASLEPTLDSKPIYVRIALTRALTEMVFVTSDVDAIRFAQARARVACFVAIAKQEIEGFNFDPPPLGTPFDASVQNVLPFAQIKCWPPGQWDSID